MDFEEKRPAQDAPLEQTQQELSPEEQAQADAAKQEEERLQRREKRYETFTILHDLVYILACITVIFVFFFRLNGVDGSSMYPTFVNHDYLVLESNFLYRNVGRGARPTGGGGLCRAACQARHRNGRRRCGY